MKLYVQSEPDKTSGPVGGSQGLESRCEKDPIDFASMPQTLREKKKSPVFTQHCFTFNFHEDNNSRGIFLTSLSLLVFKKHTFLYMHIRQKHSLKIQPSYLFLPFYAFFFFYSCLCYITLAFYLFRLIIFY